MRPEARALLDKAMQSIEAASNLRRDGFLDFAASRAYYAMFYIAQALLLEQGLSFSSHSAVISSFGKEFARTGRLDTRFHRYLIDAQDSRNIGDYGIGPGISDEQVQDSLNWAVEFLDAAEQLLNH